MQDEFEIPIIYKGEEIVFPARLVPYGYIHRFQVDIFGQEVFFEPDEERNYRALVEGENINKKVTIDLLNRIAEAINDILK